MSVLICLLKNSLLSKVVSKSVNNNFSRLYRSKNKMHPPRVPNPGIDNRLKMMKSCEPYSDHPDVDMDDIESDFMNAGNMLNTHHSEVNDYKESTRLKIVGQKYFKSDAQPNFLTWAEKEQIRYLHDTDSVEWSIENLAESFPASENVIKKLITSRWKPDDTNKIVKHDHAVQANWKQLREGRLKIDSVLKSHLLKFGKRNQHLPVPPKLFQQGSEITYPRKTEFLNIIKSYKNSMESCAELNLKTIASSNDVHNAESVCPNSRESPITDTYTLDGSTSKKTDQHFTLSHYRTTHTHPSLNDYGQNGTSVQPDNTSMETSKRTQKSHKFNESENRVSISSTSLVTSTSKENILYLEKITIPKNKWKQGGTYKVGECYYDDDGEFLYRVPGM